MRHLFKLSILVSGAGFGAISIALGSGQTGWLLPGALLAFLGALLYVAFKVAGPATGTRD